MIQIREHALRKDQTSAKVILLVEDDASNADCIVVAATAATFCTSHCAPCSGTNE